MPWESETVTGVESAADENTDSKDKVEANGDGSPTTKDGPPASSRANATGVSAAGTAKRGKQALQAAWDLAVKRCVLFHHLTGAEVKHVQNTAQLIETAVDMALFSQGDMPSALFLVADGTYRATIHADLGSVGSKARDYGPGDNFGGCELLATIGGRGCTVTCLTAGMVWAVNQRTVKTKLRVPPPLKVPGLHQFCKGVKLFQPLSAERLVQLCRAAVQTELAPGEAIFNEDDDARDIYALREGSLHSAQRGTSFSLQMSPPETFGESSLFPDDGLRVRRAAVLAGERGATVVSFAVDAIETLLGFELQGASLALFNRKMLEAVSCVGKSIAEGLHKDALDELVGLMVRRTYTPGEALASEGDFDEAIFMIESGEAGATKGEGSSHVLATLKRGDCFGEQMLLQLPAGGRRGSRRKASIVCGDSGLVALRLSLHTFEHDLMGRGSLRAWAVQLVNDVVVASSAHPGLDSCLASRNIAAFSAAAVKKASPPGAGKRHSQSAPVVAAAASARPLAITPPPPAPVASKGGGGASLTNRASAACAEPSPSSRTGGSFAKGQTSSRPGSLTPPETPKASASPAVSPVSRRSVSVPSSRASIAGKQGASGASPTSVTSRTSTRRG